MIGDGGEEIKSVRDVTYTQQVSIGFYLFAGEKRGIFVYWLISFEE